MRKNKSTATLQKFLDEYGEHVFLNKETGDLITLQREIDDGVWTLATHYGSYCVSLRFDPRKIDMLIPLGLL